MHLTTGEGNMLHRNEEASVDRLGKKENFHENKNKGIIACILCV